MVRVWVVACILLLVACTGDGSGTNDLDGGASKSSSTSAGPLLTDSPSEPVGVPSLVDFADHVRRLSCGQGEPAVARVHHGRPDPRRTLAEAVDP